MEITTLIIGLILLLGIHSVSIVSVSWRDGVVARIGLAPWQGLYSVVAIAGLALVVWGYGMARQSPMILYMPPPWLRDVAALLIVPVFPLVFAAYLPGRIRAAMKHPMLVATKLWAAAHLLANGSLADVLLFGSLLAWAVANRISVKSRAPRDIPAAPPSRWNDPLAVLVGLLLYAVFLLGGHQWLIGVPAGSPWR
jgi:uncharacterized membrane protein